MKIVYKTFTHLFCPPLTFLWRNSLLWEGAINLWGREFCYYTVKTIEKCLKLYRKTWVLSHGWQSGRFRWAPNWPLRRSCSMTTRESYMVAARKPFTPNFWNYVSEKSIINLVKLWYSVAKYRKNGSVITSLSSSRNMLRKLRFKQTYRSLETRKTKCLHSRFMILWSSSCTFHTF
jgi:hypothetical protein